MSDVIPNRNRAEVLIRETYYKNYDDKVIIIVTLMSIRCDVAGCTVI